MSNDFILLIICNKSSIRSIFFISLSDKNKHSFDKGSLVFLSPFLTYLEKNIQLIHSAKVYWMNETPSCVQGSSIQNSGLWHKTNWIFLVNAKSLEFLLLPTKKAMSWMRNTINSLRCLNQECCLEGYFF